jgi:hypothetical protein
MAQSIGIDELYPAHAGGNHRGLGRDPSGGDGVARDDGRSGAGRLPGGGAGSLDPDGGQCSAESGVGGGELSLRREQKDSISAQAEAVIRTMRAVQAMVSE